MSEQSSNTSQTASAFYDPDSWCWRTSQGSLLSEEYPLLERLPDWGTTADGALCVQATPEHLTGVRDGSASPNLPTPAAWDGARGPDLARANRPNSGGMDLVTVTERLLPTPVVNDMGRGKTPEEWDSWTDEMKHRHGNGNGHGPSLEIEAARLLPTPTSQAAKHGPTPDIHANGFGSNLWDLPHLLPTPTARDWKDTGDLKKSVPDDDSLLPRAIAHHVISDPTQEQSDDGNGSSDDQPPPQAMIEDSDPSLSSG